MGSKKRLKAVIVAAGIVVALLIGIAAGIAYQKAQPVNIQLTTYSDGGDRVFDVQTYTMTEKNSLGLSTGSRVVRENNVSSYVVELKN